MITGQVVKGMAAHLGQQMQEFVEEHCTEIAAHLEAERKAKINKKNPAAKMPIALKVVFYKDGKMYTSVSTAIGHKTIVEGPETCAFEGTPDMFA